jgi:hypothetical protein
MIDNFPEMPDEKQIPDAVEPPKIYIPSCGVLCDVFWWARRTPEPPAPTADKPTP